MVKTSFYLRTIWATALILIVSVPFCQAGIKPKHRPDWKTEKVDLRLGGGRQIKAIYYPAEKPVPTRAKQKTRPAVQRKKISGKKPKSLSPQTGQVTTQNTVFANIVDSPPVDGFIPHIAVSVTKKRYYDTDSRFDAEPSFGVLGIYPPSVDSSTDYAIGLFDTGASAHVMGNAAAMRLGLFEGGIDSDLLTPYPVEISGANASVFALVSQPLGLFIDGLGAINPSTLRLDRSFMAGEWNVSIAVGDTPPTGYPDLPTAIGSPLSIYFTTWIRNDQQVTITRDGTTYTAPNIMMFEKEDAQIPDYNNVIPLELRPLGGLNVQYMPTLDLGSLEFEPSTPSVIIGNSSQSLFFVHSVNLTDKGYEANDKDRFMLDTGAQVTVVGSRIAALLKLDRDWPDFEVEIVDVTGHSEMIEGFYLDSLIIPAVRESIIAYNVPVVLLDISSPEGGTMDGIIGMNLFNDFNLLLRGGGLFLQDDAVLEFQPIFRIIADIAPESGDGVVDMLDLEAFAEAWLGEGTMPPSDNWNPLANFERDNIVNMLDYAILANHWLEKSP